MDLINHTCPGLGVQKSTSCMHYGIRSCSFMHAFEVQTLEDVISLQGVTLGIAYIHGQLQEPQLMCVCVIL